MWITKGKDSLFKHKQNSSIIYVKNDTNFLMSAYKFLWLSHIFFGCLVSLNQGLNKVYMLHLVVINYTKISLVFNHKCLFLAQVTWGLSWAWLCFAPWIFWSWSPGCRSSCYLDSLFSGRREEPGYRAKLYKYLEGFCQDSMSVTSIHISMTRPVSWPKFHLWPKTIPKFFVLMKVGERRFLRPVEASMT